MWGMDLYVMCQEDTYCIFLLFCFLGGLRFGHLLLYVLFWGLELWLVFVVLFMHPLTETFREFLCVYVRERDRERKRESV